MQADSRQAYLTATLDPVLLSTPFQVQTHWHVITGAPSCGKSTLIGQLAAQGYRTVAEVARAYLEGEAAKGRTIPEIRAAGAALQRRLADLQRQAEAGLRPGEVAFLDRGLPDCLAFYRLDGVDPNALLPECFHYRYARVFLLDPLPFQRDGVRLESDAKIAAYLEAWHTRDYSFLGYEVVRVPVLPPPERLAYVLERVVGGAACRSREPS